jgi:xanthine dehydrogenase accessory factor
MTDLATAWVRSAYAAVRRGERLAMVSVVGARGSTPRESGARMLVWADRFEGTIGGGALEHQALDQARRLLAHGGCRRHALQDYPLGPMLGQCCGGHVRLLLEIVDPASQAWLGPAETARAGGRPFHLTASFHDGALARTVEAVPPLVAPDGPRVPLSEVRILSEMFTPAQPRLVIFGAGHIGQAVARAFAPLPFDLDWLASREDLRPEAGGTQATILSEDELEGCVEAAPPGTLFAIFTHSHELDYRLTRAVLAKGDFGYLGLIGSRTKRARFESRLTADGFTADHLARLTCPLGVRTLKSKAPAVIAISLAAELLQLTEEDAA